MFMVGDILSRSVGNLKPTIYFVWPCGDDDGCGDGDDDVGGGDWDDDSQPCTIGNCNRFCFSSL